VATSNPIGFFWDIIIVFFGINILFSWSDFFRFPVQIFWRVNIIVILSDDHRYDFMSFMEESPQDTEFLETPNLDRIAAEGAHLANAFVSTSLCSPSRASILTGQYMRNHRVVDNQRPVPEGTVFFPEYLQEAGYTDWDMWENGTWGMKTTLPGKALITG